MAAHHTTQNTAMVLPFVAGCTPVTRTDRRRRLPAISSSEVDVIFDHLNAARNSLRKAA